MRKRTKTRATGVTTLRRLHILCLLTQFFIGR